MRRELLAGVGAAAPLLKAAAGHPQLKITAMETFVVKVNQRGNWVFLRLKTDRGVTGLGEASHGAGAFGRLAGEGDRRMIEELGKFFEAVRDRSPFDIEAYRQRMRPRARAGGRLAGTAFSALEQALWDVAGKALGAPVYELLGGRVRDRLEVYANINRATNLDRSPEAFAANARKAAAEGFTAIKAATFDDFPKLDAPAAELDRFTELGISRIEAIRRAIGPERALLIDVHSHFDVARSIEVARRLEPQRLFWYEEPVAPERLEDTAAIRAAVKQRMAGGEALFGIESFAPLCRRKALEVVMPDVKHCGGILEGRKIAAIAEVDSITVAPHNPSGPVATAASVQLCAGLPNFLILEHAWGEVSWRHELVTPPEQFSAGKLSVPEGAGFGIELNEKAVRGRG